MTWICVSIPPHNLTSPIKDCKESNPDKSCLIPKSMWEGKGLRTMTPTIRVFARPPSEEQFRVVDLLEGDTITQLWGKLGFPGVVDWPVKLVSREDVDGIATGRNILRDGDKIFFEEPSSFGPERAAI